MHPPHISREDDVWQRLFSLKLHWDYESSPLPFLGTLIIVRLSDILMDEYEKDTTYSTTRIRDTGFVVPHIHSYALDIGGHETGPELTVYALASFWVVASASGIFGNFAYDILKSISQKLLAATHQAFEEVALKRFHHDDTEKKALEGLVISVRSPGGFVTAHFDVEKGIPPEFIEYFIRKLKRYQAKTRD
jgi:hypothetical protein